jgi:valyl-tRNA synthetase
MCIVFPQELDNNYWVSSRSEEEARQKASKRFNVPEEKISLKQGAVTFS